MKKILYACIALATAFAAISCQGEDELIEQPTSKPMVIKAVADGIGAGTRATMAYKYDILWSTGDQIYVKNSTNNATFTLKTGQGTTNGTFECQSSPFASGDAVEALYPASLVKDGNLVWPAQQTSNTVVPMYSKKTLVGTGTENFSFASLGAVLQIVFNTEQANVTLKSITIKDDMNPLSGIFTVNEDGKAVMNASADAPGITLDLGETGKKLGKGANYFNIAVPAGTYSKFSIIFTATDNTVCTLKGSVTINHNTVGRLILTGEEFYKFGQGKAFATGPNCYVRWVQLWDNGPKFAEYNVGVTDSKAESYGGYYTWGGTHDNTLLSEYVSDFNKSKDISSLIGQDDTATNLWGSNWRMPTEDELLALFDNCTIEKVDDPNGNDKILGIKFKGKSGTAYADNSIFLPACGYNDRGDVSGQGYYGRYWSSTAGAYAYAYYLYFTSDSHDHGYNSRIFAQSVRAVLAEQD